jgi:hypothetical protein
MILHGGSFGLTKKQEKEARQAYTQELERRRKHNNVHPNNKLPSIGTFEQYLLSLQPPKPSEVIDLTEEQPAKQKKRKAEKQLEPEDEPEEVPETEEEQSERQNKLLLKRSDVHPAGGKSYHIINIPLLEELDEYHAKNGRIPTLYLHEGKNKHVGRMTLSDYMKHRYPDAFPYLFERLTKPNEKGFFGWRNKRTGVVIKRE